METKAGKLIVEAYQKVFENSNREEHREDEPIVEEKEKSMGIIQVEEAGTCKHDDTQQVVVDNTMEQSLEDKVQSQYPNPKETET